MTATKLKLATEGHLEHASRIDRRIAMEAGFLSNFATTIREAIPSMLTSISDALSSLSFSDQISRQKTISNNRTAFLNAIKKSNFVELSDTKIFVPEGFQGHLPSYVEVLKLCANHAGKVVADVLMPYNLFLSQLLSSDDARLSSFGKLGYLSNTDVKREEFTKLTSNYFVKGSTQVKQPYGKTFNRNSEWEDMFISQNETVKAIEQVNRKTVQNSVDDCVQLIEAIKQATNDGEMNNLSGPMVKQLSSATLSVANEVAFYSITVYRVNGMEKVIDETIDILTKELKK